MSDVFPRVHPLEIYHFMGFQGFLAGLPIGNQQISINFVRGPPIRNRANPTPWPMKTAAVLTRAVVSIATNTHSTNVLVASDDMTDLVSTALRPFRYPFFSQTLFPNSPCYTKTKWSAPIPASFSLSTVLAQDRFFSDSLSFTLDIQDPQSHHDDVVVACGPQDSIPAFAADLMRKGARSVLNGVDSCRCTHQVSNARVTCHPPSHLLVVSNDMTNLVSTALRPGFASHCERNGPYSPA